MPSENFVLRDECQEREKEHRESLNRIHNRIDIIERSTSSIETSAKIMSDSVCKMEKIIFGDLNADGLTTKVSNLNQKVQGIYWFTGVVITTLIISLVSSLMALILKK